jgi:hypothetical protein
VLVVVARGGVGATTTLADVAEATEAEEEDTFEKP